tara:strand:+ start:321 stop:590 length:270 start_codon:yes stop_codon:yes gene_type:complete
MKITRQRLKEIIREELASEARVPARARPGYEEAPPGEDEGTIRSKLITRLEKASQNPELVASTIKQLKHQELTAVQLEKIRGLVDRLGA